MSNSILYDSLLVRHLAAELHRTLRGRACAAALAFPGERRAVLPLDGGEALVLDLHPLRGWIRLLPWEQGDELEAVCEAVQAPLDERRIEISLRLADRYRAEQRSVVVELATNQWNALLLGEGARILSLAWSRQAGHRDLRSGQVYAPPPFSPRFGAGEVRREEAVEVWERTLGPVPAGELADAVVRGFAFTGPLSARFIAGAAPAEAPAVALRAAFARWWELRSLEQADPVALRVAGRTLPYPLPLDGHPFQRTAGLLAAMDAAAEATAQEAAVGPSTDLVPFISSRLRAASRRVARLERALADGPASADLRSRADLLLSHLHLVQRGTDSAVLVGWEGEPVEISLDPALSPAENAARIYDAARRRQRAEEQIPGLLQEANLERQRWEEALAEAGAGSVPGWVRDALERSEPAEPARGAVAESTPYRVYRTSGGLEVRVGKSAKDNDRLTFRHAAPEEVWLHARSVPGSHVILRWSDPSSAPPARDLLEAAGLAALFSRARSSSLVPVDWTRRKHVRKPRGAPPGAVLPQRVKTLFVEPDEALEARLRVV